MDTTEEIWYHIPGFPGYEVSSAYRVRNKSGKLLAHRNREYCLWRDKKRYSIYAPRLLYGVLHNIDPTKLKKVLIVDIKGELTLMTQSEYSSYINSGIRKPDLNKDTAIEYYKNAIRFAQLVLSYYETNDISEVAEELLKYEEGIKVYMRKAKYSTSDEVINEAWSAVLANVLSYISEGRASILEPNSYLRRSVRFFFSAVRQRNKKEGMQLDWRTERLNPDNRKEYYGI